MRLSPLQRHTATSRSRGRKAASVVEFAVIMALYLGTFLYGMFELSRAMMVLEVMTNAARSGARAGVQSGAANSDVTTAVTNVMSSYGLSGTQIVSITVSDPSDSTNTTDVSKASSGSEITVQVSMKVKDFAWTAGYFFLKKTASNGTDLQLNSQALTMRKN